MPRISVLVKNEGQVTIGEGENALHVTYAPNAYTPMLEDMYKKSCSNDCLQGLWRTC